MVQYTVRRLGASALVMVLITMITFAIFQLAPGGPAIMLDEQLSQHDRDEIRANLGLDKPLPVQYYRWQALLTGDLGNYYMEREPVSHLLAQRLANTLIPAGAARRSQRDSRTPVDSTRSSTSCAFVVSCRHEFPNRSGWDVQRGTLAPARSDPSRYFHTCSGAA